MAHPPDIDPGLCAGCVHARRVTGARSRFWSCARAATDPSFARYPRLPVLTCRGFEPARGAPPPARSHRGRA